MIRIAVLGAGSAGVQAIAHILSSVRDVKVTCIHDPKQPILGIGESTNPPFIAALQNGANFMIYDSYKNNDLDMTIKLGTRFKKWREWEFTNPFLSGTAAIHMDTFKLNDFAFKRFKEKYPKRFEEIHGFAKDIENKKDRVTLKIDDKNYKFHYLIDCSGFPKEYGDDYVMTDETVNHCFVHNKKEDGSNILYTGHIATSDGWMFEVPLKSRISYGYLFNNKITDPKTAKENFAKEMNVPVDQLDDIEYKFKPYYTNKLIDNRIIKNGNKAVFFEPISANSLAIYNEINHIIKEYIFSNNKQTEKRLNRKFMMEAKYLEEAIAFHYHGGSTYDTDFWKFIVDYSNKVLSKSTKFQELKQLPQTTYGYNWSWFYHHDAWTIVDREMGFNYMKKE